MLLRTKGISVNINDPLVGKVTRDANKLEETSFLICENEIPKINEKNFRGILTNLEFSEEFDNLPVVTKVVTFDHLSEGDLIVVNKDGNIKTLYRVNSVHNVLFATERCN